MTRTTIASVLPPRPNARHWLWRFVRRVVGITLGLLSPAVLLFIIFGGVTIDAVTCHEARAVAWQKSKWAKWCQLVRTLYGSSPNGRGEPDGGDTATKPQK